MPTPTNNSTLRTDAYKKLIRERCPDLLKTNEGQVFSSIIISLSERLDRTEAENAWLKKAVKSTAFMLQALTDDSSGGGEIETAATEEEVIEGEGGATTATTGTAGGGGGGSVKTPQRKQDATPFPSGVPSSKAEAEAQAAAAARAGAAPAGGPPVAAPAGPANKTGPMEEDLPPNVQGGPAVNPQPIPNGRRPNA